jgi:hypothetical protein
MSGIDRSPIGGQALNHAGFLLTTGYGSWDDYGVVKGRRQYKCAHSLPNSRPLRGECVHPVIEPGERHVLTRQAWLDVDRVSIPCLLAAGILTPGLPPSR